jgi:hypothetical protein
MPSLVLLGRKSVVAGDDLRLHCVVWILLRCLQLVLLIVLLVLLLNIRDSNNEDFADICISLNGLAAQGEALASFFWVLSMTVVVFSLPLEILM